VILGSLYAHSSWLFLNIDFVDRRKVFRVRRRVFEIFISSSTEFVKNLPPNHENLQQVKKSIFIKATINTRATSLKSFKTLAGTLRTNILKKNV